MAQPLERTIHDLDQWNETYQEGKKFLTNYGKPFRVTMTSERDRTKQQNKFIHAVFKDIAGQLKHMGKNASYWKSLCKEKLGKKIVYFDLEENTFLEVVSTTKYSTQEMADFFTKIQAFFAEKFQIEIKEPEEM